jgi:phage/plasmid-like protein (TIGR03299 family)
MDNIDMTGGKANMAFLGPRNDIWHRLGQEMKPGMSIDEWAVNCGFVWTAEKVPAYAELDSRFPNNGPVRVDDRFFIVRSDNAYILSPSTVSKIYRPVQPREVLDWFYRYIAVDDRFQLDVAGSLKKGEIIWATATYRDTPEVGGDKHVMRLLMTTTFDGTGSTINKGTATRVVCNNTLDAALRDSSCTVRTRHSTKFDAAKVGKELAAVAQGFKRYKAMGDALALNEMTNIEISKFFKVCLDIPFDAKQNDISARKMNQFDQLVSSYKITRSEGATGAWAALNAITRYVDHERNVRASSGGEVAEARFISSQFGSGHLLKSKALGLLLPRIKDKVEA